MQFKYLAPVLLASSLASGQVISAITSAFGDATSGAASVGKSNLLGLVNKSFTNSSKPLLLLLASPVSSVMLPAGP